MANEHKQPVERVKAVLRCFSSGVELVEDRQGWSQEEMRELPAGVKAHFEAGLAYPIPSTLEEERICEALLVLSKKGISDADAALAHGSFLPTEDACRKAFLVALDSREADIQIVALQALRGFGSRIYDGCANRRLLFSVLAKFTHCDGQPAAGFSSSPQVRAAAFLALEGIIDYMDPRADSPMKCLADWAIDAVMREGDTDVVEAAAKVLGSRQESTIVKSRLEEMSRKFA